MCLPVRIFVLVTVLLVVADAAPCCMSCCSCCSGCGGGGGGGCDGGGSNDPFAAQATEIVRKVMAKKRPKPPKTNAAAKAPPPPPPPPADIDGEKELFANMDDPSYTDIRAAKPAKPPAAAAAAGGGGPLPGVYPTPAPSAGKKPANAHDGVGPVRYETAPGDPPPKMDPPPMAPGADKAKVVEPVYWTD
ncbi:actin nucleation-promoting factor WAS [Aedes albopictus]|uniref:Uncharacterized protein n=1 Tax=Aedes albopictus TaxID=7160 RepID=A0ABM1Z423_AEDAL|nr:wiskott-Aldrich syndrome protein homolog [Aedes albopictus]